MQQADDREAMEAAIITQFLAIVVLAVLAFLTAHRRRRRSRHGGAMPPPVVVVGDADTAGRLIVEHAGFFSDHPILPLGIDLDAGHPKTSSITSAPHGPLWRALRRNLAAGVLHSSRLARLLSPIHRDAVEALLAGVSARVAAGNDGDAAGFVVRDGLYAAVFAAAARLCLGNDGVGELEICAMRRLLWDFFHSDVNAVVLLTSARARLVHWKKWRELLATRRRLGEVFGPVVAARRLSRRRGNAGGEICCYLDSLLDVRIPDAGGGDDDATGRGLRDDEIVKLVWEFLGSSTEAVVASVEWTLAHLVASPEVQSKLHRELAAAGDHRSGHLVSDRDGLPPYLRAVILESLRLHPPLPMLVRHVGAEGAKVAGITPPPDGTIVGFLFDAEQVGKNPKAWTDPEEFRPERFLAFGEGEHVGAVPGHSKEIRMMPFGVGRRHCPGAGLSKVQVGGFVAALVREFEWAPPPLAGEGGDGVDLTNAVTLLFVKYMASPLRARVTPRRAQC